MGKQQYAISESKADKARQKIAKKEVDIDMNPMVDLAFLLLTFFMLTTTFQRPQAMELVMPAKPEKEAIIQEQPIKESRALSIYLGDENKVFWFVGLTDPDVQIADYSKDGIRKVLLEKNEEIQDIVVFIKPADASNYQNLVDILDEMAITGIQRYAIVDPTPEDEILIANNMEP